MFLFTIISKPKIGNDEVDSDVGGAYTNVWIDFPEQDAAELIARHYIEEAGWEPGLTDEVNWVERDSYSDDHEALPHYLEAKEHGSMIVFQIWPIDAPAANADYDSDDKT